MLPIIKTRDEIFDDLIYDRSYENIPRDTVFLHNSVLADKQVNQQGKLKTTDKKLYHSPFRSNINELILEESIRLKNLKYPTTSPNSIYNKDPVIKKDQLNLREGKDKKQVRGNEPRERKKKHHLDKKPLDYAHDIDFPKELINIQKMQNKILVDLDEKEKTLRKWKESQRIIEINEEPTDEKDIIKEKIDIDSVPKVPNYLYEPKDDDNKKAQKVKKLVKADKIIKNTKEHSKEVNTLRNPVAKKKNPEMIVKFNGKLYSKEIWDNIQYDKYHHNLLIKAKREENETRFLANENKWATQLNNILEKIDKLKIDINTLDTNLAEKKHIYESENINSYFSKVAGFNKEKNKIIKDIQNLNDFEYEWEHSKATTDTADMTSDQQKHSSDHRKHSSDQSKHSAKPVVITSPKYIKKNADSGTKHLGEDSLFEYTMEEETKYA